MADGDYGRILEAYKRAGKFSESDLSWFSNLLTDIPDIQVVMFWVGGDPQNVLVGTMLVPKNVIGETVQYFADNDSLQLSLEIELGSAPNNPGNVVLGFGTPNAPWPPGQPSADALAKPD
jgi:hypothetical protein